MLCEFNLKPRILQKPQRAHKGSTELIIFRDTSPIICLAKQITLKSFARIFWHWISLLGKMFQHVHHITLFTQSLYAPSWPSATATTMMTRTKTSKLRLGLVHVIRSKHEMYKMWNFWSWSVGILERLNTGILLNWTIWKWEHHRETCYFAFNFLLL